MRDGRGGGGATHAGSGSASGSGPGSSRTEPGAAEWGPTPPSHRRYERRSAVGSGEADWERASRAVLRWGVKTRSGFAVPGADETEVRVGQRLEVRLRIGPVVVREPVEVVEVVRTEDRVGFAYRTAPGHPVDGEEAFVVTREGETVSLTLRSLTRPSTTRGWALVFPLLVAAQVVVRWRYRRALR
ncbi:DUF1990 family protein [Curtobacterium sp. MCBD17_021]|uniref:DUF1990 family protein n=1 Tax=Curtobacterium sp. MCBD17_021 TaxID=2175665 RepID=UPI000DA98600|nr:DUF1990 family protein [Curtobacterium sp. MCBD17_021]PZE65949.1 DUF1990 domain-containing protein [Curtobacterium sp. MCBD17_021]